jgi:hypothetical protein
LADYNQNLQRKEQEILQLKQEEGVLLQLQRETQQLDASKNEIASTNRSLLENELNNKARGKKRKRETWKERKKEREREKREREREREHWYRRVLICSLFLPSSFLSFFLSQM